MIAFADDVNLIVGLVYPVTIGIRDGLVTIFHDGNVLFRVDLP